MQDKMIDSFILVKTDDDSNVGEDGEAEEEK